MPGAATESRAVEKPGKQLEEGRLGWAEGLTTQAVMVRRAVLQEALG